MTITVKYRGGPEAWYEIRARGAVIRVPGHSAVHDVLEAINRGGEPERRAAAVVESNVPPPDV